MAEAEAALRALVDLAAAKELEALLNGEADGNDTFLEINAGAGGTESCDWANMLARMYVRWAEKKGYTVELQSESPGEEAGIKSAAYKISGPQRLWLAEVGIGRAPPCPHLALRLARRGGTPRSARSGSIRWWTTTSRSTSPTRTSGSTPTGRPARAASTSTRPTRRCGSPTCPPGIVVTSSMKSQHQNREIAMKALRSRLYQLELDKRNAAINAAHENKGDAGWGNQIRSYVLQPYQMVKDLRTGYETSDTQGVLDGDLDRFMAATLALDVAGKSRAEANAE